MNKTYEQFKASLLYCNKCTRAMPVREPLLLVLPTGELYEYLCQGCGNSLGSKRETAPVDIKPASSQTLSKTLKNIKK